MVASELLFRFLGKPVTAWAARRPGQPVEPSLAEIVRGVN